MTKLQRDVVRLAEWSVENGMKINRNKRKAIIFTRVSKWAPLNYYLLGMLVPVASSCKYLAIILRSELSWTDQVNYAVKRPGKFYTL